MKTSLVVITFTSLLATSVHARVGETLKQIEGRYGRPQRVLNEGDAFPTLGYDYRGFMVGVTYVRGICKSEGFARPNIARFSDADVQQILALSLAPGTSWKLVEEKNGNRLWARSDGKVIAFLHAQKFFQIQEKGFDQPTH